MRFAQRRPVRAGDAAGDPGVDPKRLRILDEIVSREPMGPYVAQSDERWFTIVRWVIQVTQIADARAVDAASLTKIDEAADGELRRLAGKEAGSASRWD